MNKTTFHGEISIFTYFHYETTIFFNVKPLNPHFIPLFVSGDPRDPLRQAKTQGHRPGAVRSRATEAMKIDQRGIETWKFYMVYHILPSSLQFPLQNRNSSAWEHAAF